MFGAVTLGRNIMVAGGCQGATNTKVNSVQLPALQLRRVT
jgi:hypothetical protein